MLFRIHKLPLCPTLPPGDIERLQACIMAGMPTAAPLAPTLEPTDHLLTQHYGQGHVPSFDMLYTRHKLGVWRYVFRSVRDAGVTDDLLQDVWFAVAR